eukprot:1145556-Pelagomonas_calceolata.AAC.1
MARAELCHAGAYLQIPSRLACPQKIRFCTATGTWWSHFAQSGADAHIAHSHRGWYLHFAPQGQSHFAQPQRLSPPTPPSATGLHARPCELTWLNAEACGCSTALSTLYTDCSCRRVKPEPPCAMPAAGVPDAGKVGGSGPPAPRPRRPQASAAAVGRKGGGVAMEAGAALGPAGAAAKGAAAAKEAGAAAVGADAGERQELAAAAAVAGACGCGCGGPPGASALLAALSRADTRASKGWGDLTPEAYRACRARTSCSACGKRGSAMVLGCNILLSLLLARTSEVSGKDFHEDVMVIPRFLFAVCDRGWKVWNVWKKGRGLQMRTNWSTMKGKVHAIAHKPSVGGSGPGHSQKLS